MAKRSLLKVGRTAPIFSCTSPSGAIFLGSRSSTVKYNGKVGASPELQMVLRDTVGKQEFTGDFK